MGIVNCLGAPCIFHRLLHRVHCGRDEVRARARSTPSIGQTESPHARRGGKFYGIDVQLCHYVQSADVVPNSHAYECKRSRLVQFVFKSDVSPTDSRKVPT